tara:strand:+ start:675 stop:1493 length:819 start_codon:yes stop_codon:yes gene_type:complete
MKSSFLFLHFLLLTLIVGCNTKTNDGSNTEKIIISYTEKDIKFLIQENEKKVLFLSFWKGMSQNEFKVVGHHLSTNGKLIEKEDYENRFQYKFNLKSSSGSVLEIMGFLQPLFDEGGLLVELEIVIEQNSKCGGTLYDCITSRNVESLKRLYENKYGVPKEHYYESYFFFNKFWIFSNGQDNIIQFKEYVVEEFDSKIIYPPGETKNDLMDLILSDDVIFEKGEKIGEHVVRIGIVYTTESVLQKKEILFQERQEKKEDKKIQLIEKTESEI